MPAKGRNTKAKKRKAHYYYAGKEKKAKKLTKKRSKKPKKPAKKPKKAIN